MTIRKLWLIILISISFISIGINVMVLTTLTNRYFIGYLAKDYEKNVNQILDYTKSALSEENISFKQMAIELGTHFRDPIIGIRLYSRTGEKLVDVNNANNIQNKNTKISKKSMHKFLKEVKEYKIEDNGEIIGVLHITTRSSTKNSMIAGVFRSKLLLNSLFSMLIAMCISIIIGIIISKKMSSDLINTAELANNIQIGVNGVTTKSSIFEITRIRESLEELNTRLKIKQKNRKELIDQLMHQTRTPLTILKSHLEGVEDGIIEMNEDEIDIWKNQIDNITVIIANMSGMIDANKENDDLVIEKFDVSQLINQIVSGISPQFLKKEILLNVLSHDKIFIETDQYKLSQIIYNILTNAYKYTENNGSVDIDYFVNNGNIYIEIKDTGVGISKDDIDKIFNAYYRSPEVLEINGDGIGLYVVNENLKLINGSIEVLSEINKGSTFIINLPLSLNLVNI